jgi:hypothetical protein
MFSPDSSAASSLFWPALAAGMASPVPRAIIIAKEIKNKYLPGNRISILSVGHEAHSWFGLLSLCDLLACSNRPIQGWIGIWGILHCACRWNITSSGHIFQVLAADMPFI